jgi:N-acetylneuraminic acid mutarotase
MLSLIRRNKVKQLFASQFVLLVLCSFVILLSAGRSTAGATEISWERGPDISLPRGGYFAAWYKGGLVVAGGTYWKDRKKLWTDQVSFYNPSHAKWEEWPSLPRPIAYGVMAQTNGKLYLIGGTGETNLHRDIYRLDGRNWQRIGEAPAAFLYGSATVAGGEIYITGGGTSITDATQVTNQAWAYNPKSGKWRKLPDVPGAPRELHVSGIVGNYLYVFGGYTQRAGESPRNLGDAYRYNITRNEWSQIKDTPEPVRASFGAAVKGGIFMFGGFGTKGLNVVYRYDVRKNDYQAVSKMPLPLMDTKFFFAKGKFYGAAGEDKGGSRFSGLLIGELKN